MVSPPMPPHRCRRWHNGSLSAGDQPGSPYEKLKLYCGQLWSKMDFREWPLLAQGGHSKHRLRLVWVLRDRNDLKLLTGCTDYIPNSFAHQRPCHWGHEGNGTGLRVRFVLSHDMIFLHAPIVAPEGHGAPKGDSVS
jgi:hypothetical protein